MWNMTKSDTWVITVKATPPKAKERGLKELGDPPSLSVSNDMTQGPANKIR